MDHLPGDPARVKDQAASMVRAAERMMRAADTLERIDGGAYESDAIDAMQVNTTKVATILRGASTRYRGTGEALQDYAEVLDSAQRQAGEANAALAQTNVDGARWEVASREIEVNNPLLLLPDREGERDLLHRELVQARQELHAQESAAHDAQEHLQRAKGDVDEAAEIAIRRIHMAVERSGLKDSLWSDLKGWFDRNLENIKGVLDVVASIASAVALLTAWIPVVGLVAGAVALTASVLSMGITLYQFQRGEIGWRETLVAAAFTVLSIVPGVRAAGKLGKILKQGNVGVAIKKGVSRRLTHHERILFRSEPGEAHLPGASQHMREVLGHKYSGLVPDIAKKLGEHQLKDWLTDGARDMDRADRGGPNRCYATSTGGGGSW